VSGRPRPPNLTYGSYLKIEELLALQKPLSDPQQHDELLFIVIHQVFELWFRQMIHEAEAIMRELPEEQVMRATHHYVRLIEIQRVLLQQIRVLETMTPIEFNRFRELLNPASGFQSRQFRELEFISNMKDATMLAALTLDETARQTLQRRLDGPTLLDAFDAVLRVRGFAMPGAGGAGLSEARLAALKQIYDQSESYADLYQLCEAMIEYDENFQLWRYHHVRMVERMIGRKKGTGGSDGVAYLNRTLDRKCFPELWEVRTQLSGADYGG
jgi:tryptophan 2,3-dioxygenase